MRLRLAVLLATVVALAAPAPAPAASTVGARILPILRDTGLAGADTAVAVVDVSTGKLTYRRNAWRPLVPASNEKLFTSVTALSQLGPNFRFTTRVAGTGVQVGSTWRGNLYLVGSGDPTFSRAGIAALVRGLRAHGIRHVAGRVLGDESVFDPVRYGPGWKHSYYGLESPPLSGLALDRDTTWRGQVVGNPPRVAARALMRTLEARGVTVAADRVGVGRAPTTATVLASLQSPRLWRIVRFMDRESDNFTAEMLLKAVGAYAGAGGSTAGGLAVQHELLSGLLPQDAGLLTPIDGSGLSHENRATASGLARLLARAAEEPNVGRALADALAVPGQPGTLQHRFLGVPQRTRIRAKTGTLDGASSLSGYVWTPSGRELAFSIIMNGRWLQPWLAHQAQDRIVASLARGR